MSRAGAPLVFLGQVVGGWIAIRLLVALPVWYLPTKPVAARRKAVAAPAYPVATASPAIRPDAPGTSRRAGMMARPRIFLAVPHMMGVNSRGQAPQPIAAVSGMAWNEQAPSDAVPSAEGAEIPGAVAHGAGASRWSATAWMLWRPDGAGGLASGPLLGGSQAGVRIDYRLWTAGGRSLGLYGRLSRAFERPFAEEAALGVALRPVAALPVALLAERRMRLGQGGRTGFALLAAGGIGPRAIGPRFVLEGYAQGGVVGLPGADGFADGSLSLDYRLSPAASPPELALGAVVSGSVQPGAGRLDIGPQLRVRLPVAGGHLRLSAEWRERVAGDARPSSGPVLTLVADF